VVDNIFTTELPALVNQQDSTYTLGTTFSVLADGFILGTRVYVGAVPTSPSPKGLLYLATSRSTGDLLAQKDFGTLVAGQWNEILFDDPVEVVTGQDYVTAWGPTNNYSATGGFFDSTDVINGNVQALRSLFDRPNGKFHVGTSFTFPDETFNGGCYFVDTIFQLPGEETVSYIGNSFFFGAAV
jgi:hypothetical protein